LDELRHDLDDVFARHRLTVETFSTQQIQNFRHSPLSENKEVLLLMIAVTPGAAAKKQHSA
jgi:hypothetical protein